MSWIDIGIVTVLSLSGLLSLVRGFVREFVSLATWVVAIWAAMAFAGRVSGWLPDFVDRAHINVGGTEIQLLNLRVAVAFVLILLVTLVLGALVNFAMARIVTRGSLNLVDRFLGLVFGVLRGGVIVVILVLMAGLTRFPQTHWWGESRFVEAFESVAVWLVDKLPQPYGNYFSY